jgi:hypothetical protein
LQGRPEGPSEEFHRALAALHRDLTSRHLPEAAVAAVSAWTEALTRWMSVLPGDRGCHTADGRLTLTEDIAATPVDLLRPRRPAMLR